MVRVIPGVPDVLVAFAPPASSLFGVPDPRSRWSGNLAHKTTRLADHGNPRVKASSNESGLVAPEKDLPRLVLMLAEGGERLRHLEQALTDPCIGDPVVRPYKLQCLSFGHWIRFVRGLLFSRPPNLAG